MGLDITSPPLEPGSGIPCHGGLGSIPPGTQATIGPPDGYIMVVTLNELVVTGMVGSQGPFILYGTQGQRAWTTTYAGIDDTTFDLPIGLVIMPGETIELHNPSSASVYWTVDGVVYPYRPLIDTGLAQPYAGETF
jgi:hypothetical protein